MASNAEIQATKSVSPLHRNLEVKPRALFTALAKGGINAAFLKWDDLAESGIEVLDSLGLARQLGEVAGLLVVNALIQAIRDLLREYEPSLKKVPKEKEIKALYKQFDEALTDSAVTIDPEFFQRPQELPFLTEVKIGLATWMEAEELVAESVQAGNISQRLPSYFVFALNDEWKKRTEEYEILLSELDTPFTQATERQKRWQHYRTWLQKQVDASVFLESFSLKQIYVPLRAYYERKAEAEEELSRPRMEKERVVVDLDAALNQWLADENKDDAIRLITGGPGSGKSSFAKIFAAQQAEKAEIPVLFVPLHLFRLTEDLTKAVGEFIEGAGFLAHNPLDIDEGESRLLIIFDGLDELSMRGKAAATVARQFIEEVRSLVNQRNFGQLQLQVLITGRDVIVQASRDKVRESQQLFYLLPYCLTENDKKRNHYVDPQKLLETDQRQKWWQKYARSTGKDYQDIPAELKRENLLEITSQPLLNYLVALTYSQDRLSFSESTNLNEIYDDLLIGVHKRQYEGRSHKQIEGIELKEFIDILCEIGLACWHGDGRTTTVEEIKAQCETSGLKELLDRFQRSFEESYQASITRLLTAFYFREGGDLRDNNKTFEFTHKSFGEYLTARRIVEEVRLISEGLEERQQNYRKGYDPSAALLNWIKVCGKSAMDHYLFQFVLDEMHLQDRKTVAQWQEHLCSLLEYSTSNGMPMEALKNRPSFQEEVRQARNAEETLLIVLDICARVTNTVIDIYWHSPNAFGEMLSRLQGQRTNDLNLTFGCLSNLNLQSCNLHGKDLTEVNLKRSNLREASLPRANLSGANLQKADLRETNFAGANLEHANLQEANLQKAELQEANLQWTNLLKANLEGANLLDAMLQEADLQEANLLGANLSDAKLQGSDLRRTNLEGADLQGANLEGANLQQANLRGADLEGANLQWADLEGANLEGANLQWADLQSANLLETNLERADVEGTILDFQHNN